jgi:hypothetical protein
MDDDERDDAGIAGYDVHLPNPNADKANSDHAKSLEALLALKNKRILEELTRFRVRSFSNDQKAPALVFDFLIDTSW